MLPACAAASSPLDRSYPSPSFILPASSRSPSLLPTQRAPYAQPLGPGTYNTDTPLGEPGLGPLREPPPFSLRSLSPRRDPSRPLACFVSPPRSAHTVASAAASMGTSVSKAADLDFDVWRRGAERQRFGRSPRRIASERWGPSPREPRPDPRDMPPDAGDGTLSGGHLRANCRAGSTTCFLYSSEAQA